MVIFYEDKYSELMSNAIQELRATTDITQLAPGAKARSLLEIINREIGAAYRTFSADFLKGFIKNATGQEVDLIGELVGLTREQANRNTVNSSAQVQKFYVDTGTFGNINIVGGIPTSFTIPVGTIIQNRALDGAQPIQYRLTESVVCASGASEAYGSVEAIEFGSVSNIGVGVLTQHNYQLYSDYLAGTLKTRNIESISFATDVESDARFKYRIINQTLSSEGANTTAVRMAALGVPGVANVTMDEYSHGIGTGTVYLKGVTPVVSESLVATVQSAIDKAKAFGNYILVKSPNLVGVELDIGLNLLQRKPAREEDALIERVRDRIYQYINGLDINEALDIDLLIRQVLRVDSNIKSTGIPTRPIDYLYIWKYSAAEDNRIRSQALNGYTARNFQRIVVEFNELPLGTEPIRVRVLS